MENANEKKKSARKLCAISQRARALAYPPTTATLRNPWFIRRLLLSSLFSTPCQLPLSTPAPTEGDSGFGKPARRYLPDHNVCLHLLFFGFNHTTHFKIQNKCGAFFVSDENERRDVLEWRGGVTLAALAPRRAFQRVSNLT